MRPENNRNKRSDVLLCRDVVLGVSRVPILLLLSRRAGCSAPEIFLVMPLNENGAQSFRTENRM